MTFNIIGIVGAVAFVAASSGAAFAGSSPFCYGGSPTPKHVCDVIKANPKPKAALVNQKVQGVSASRVGR